MLPDDRLPTEGASLLTRPLAESWQRSRGYGLTRADQHIPLSKPDYSKSYAAAMTGCRNGYSR